MTAIPIVRRTRLSELFIAWRVRRLRKKIAHLEWWEQQLARSQVEVRNDAQAARVELARWDR